MHKSLTLDTVDVVVARDLQATALQALERGEPVDYYLHPAGPEVKGCILVETLVIGDRAGQVTNGNADWGDWDEATHTILLDATGPSGEALVAGLDGHQQPAWAAPEGFTGGQHHTRRASPGPVTRLGFVFDGRGSPGMVLPFMVMGPRAAAQPMPADGWRVRCGLSGKTFSTSRVLWASGLPRDCAATPEQMEKHCRPVSSPDVTPWAMVDDGEPRWLPVALLD